MAERTVGYGHGTMSDVEPPRPPMTVGDRFILIVALALSAFITWSCIKVMYNAIKFVLQL